MSSQPEPATNDTPPASRLTEPLRELAALVLVGANALLLFVGLVNLAVPILRDDTFSRRAGGGIFDFVGLPAIVLPLLAVLLATHVHPVLSQAKTITTAAAVEYAVSGVSAVIALLGWLVGRLVEAEFRSLFTGLLVRVAFLSIFAVAAFAVFKIWRTLYRAPRSKPQASAFGQPRPYGQPGYPQPGGYPQTHGQWPGQPATYGQPVVPTQPPAPGAAEATQVVAARGGAVEATQVISGAGGGGADPTEVIQPGDRPATDRPRRSPGDGPTRSR